MEKFLLPQNLRALKSQLRQRGPGETEQAEHQPTTGDPDEVFNPYEDAIDPYDDPNNFDFDD